MFNPQSHDWSHPSPWAKHQEIPWWCADFVGDGWCFNPRGKLWQPWTWCFLGEQPAAVHWHGFMIWHQESTKKTSNKNKMVPPPKKYCYRCRIRIIACSYNIPVPHLLVAIKNPPETKSRGLDTFGSARVVAFHFSAAARKPIRGNQPADADCETGETGEKWTGRRVFCFLPAKCSDDFCLHHLA